MVKLLLVCICIQLAVWSVEANLVKMTGNMTFVGKVNPSSSKSGHGYKNFEFAVRTYDKEIFQASLNAIDKNKIEVKGFYHVSTTVGHWIEVLEEHLMVMDGKRFASSLFTSKMVDATKLTNIGMKLSTGWSSVLEIADSIEINFDAASAHSNATSTAEQTAAYTTMTDMISNLHVRNGLEKINVKPYADVHAEDVAPAPHTHLRRTSTHKSKRRKIAPATLQERLQLGAVLGEVNSINDLHAYCKARNNAQKRSYVFLMHNQETNCTNDLMKHLTAQDYQSQPFLHDIVNGFIVEFPSICISALLNGYATCGSDFEHSSYDTNIWWANCDHVATLHSLDKSQIASLGEVSVPQAIKLGKQLISNFLYNSGGPVPSVNTTGSKVKKSAEKHGKGSKSAHSSAGGADRQKFVDRCAFNLHTGSKPTDVSHKIVNGVEVAFDSHCTRSEYRFSLIDVLSGLHDDSVLYNRRFNQPSLATELHSNNPKSINNHKCFSNH